jgi:phosphate transport system protein
MMARQFEQSLAELKQMLLKMGERVEVAIDRAVRSLKEQNTRMATEVIERDVEVDRMEEEIDQLVARLIATQQPVAKDMRRLIAALKIGLDLERMADLAVDIAEVTVDWKAGDEFLGELDEIPRMAVIVQKMVHDGINSFICGDVELARRMAEMDDRVDELNLDIIRKMTAHLTGPRAEAALHLCFVSRFLERIADHATNIAESVIYIQTGERADLN